MKVLNLQYIIFLKYFRCRTLNWRSVVCSVGHVNNNLTSLLLYVNELPPVLISRCLPVDLSVSVMLLPHSLLQTLSCSLVLPCPQFLKLMPEIWRKLIWKFPRQELVWQQAEEISTTGEVKAVKSIVLLRDLGIFWEHWRLEVMSLWTAANQLPHVVSWLRFGAFVAMKWFWQSVNSSARLLIFVIEDRAGSRSVFMAFFW